MDNVQLANIITSFRYRVRVVACYRFLYYNYVKECQSPRSGTTLSPVFWKITSRSYIHAMMIDLCKLYDHINKHSAKSKNNNHVYGIEHLLDECKENSEFFTLANLPAGERYASPAEANEFFHAFDSGEDAVEYSEEPFTGTDFIDMLKSYLHSPQIKESMEKLRLQRNKIWAHNDCNLFLNPNILEEEQCLVDADIDSMIGLLDKITSALLIRLGKHVTPILPDGIDDIQYIFRAINQKLV